MKVMRIKAFLRGIILGIATFIVLAVISATIYTRLGLGDLLIEHIRMWLVSICVFNLILDSWIIKKLNK